MDIVKIAIIVSAVIALVTFISGTYEYSRQGATRRAEHFFKMRRLLKQNDTFKDFADLIDKDDQKLCDMDFKDKRDYIGLFEEIAISMNSKLIRKEVAHYMFGYYAIQCWKSNNFWSWGGGLNGIVSIGQSSGTLLNKWRKWRSDCMAECG